MFFMYIKILKQLGSLLKREKWPREEIFPKINLLNNFFGAKETVVRLLGEFGEDVTIFLVKKDYEKNTVEKVVEIKKGGSSIDEYIKDKYTKNELEALL